LTAFVSAGAGFLLAVLWFDLMFDVQALGRRDGELPESVVASTAAYYRSILRDHLLCIAAVAVVLLVQLAFAR